MPKWQTFEVLSINKFVVEDSFLKVGVGIERKGIELYLYDLRCVPNFYVIDPRGQFYKLFCALCLLFMPYNKILHHKKLL